MKPLSIVTVLGGTGSARLLETCGPARRSQMHLFTPAPVLYTRGAAVPHITHEVFEMITEDNYVLQVPLLTTNQMKSGVDTQGKGLSFFSGLEDNPIFMTFQDPSVEVPQGPMEKEKMPLWSRIGKQLFDSDMYMDYVEAFKPDMYQVLSDGCTNKESSKKRVFKAVERSGKMFSRCLERHKSSNYLMKNSSVFGVIQGGYCIERRMESLSGILPEVEFISGFVLDGFDCNGPNIENVTFDSIKDIVEAVTEKLPSDKLRVIYGCWNALTLIDLVTAGWDLFDSSMPYIVTERGCALTFSVSVENSQNNPTELENKKKLYEINLKDEIYKEDFDPIFPNCSCLTCRKHSRAYVNHLLNTKELLASVLLMIHNLHHYMEFFKAIRSSIAADTLHLLRSSISSEYQEHVKNLTHEAKSEMTSPKKIKRL